MSEERIANLLEEIRDVQLQQLQLSQENARLYQEALTVNDKARRRGKKAQIAVFVVMLLFLMFVVYAEWYANGIPQPSWVK